MTNSQPHPASSKQISYLKSLAERAGQTFAYPQSASQASAEIDRLRGTKGSSRADRRRELSTVRSDMATRRGDAASVQAEELTGYGSSATWA
jgi:hypothetical protein